VGRLAGLPASVIGRARELLAVLEGEQLVPALSVAGRPRALTPGSATAGTAAGAAKSAMGENARAGVEQLVFFAPAPAHRVVERLRGLDADSLTPLQALVLMNDPTYVEASRALAQRTLLEGGRDEKQRVEYAFRLATARKPTGKEAGVLRHLLKARLSEFQKDRGSAMKLLGVGESARDTRLDASELAAWTTVASAILNLDETITKQ